MILGEVMVPGKSLQCDVCGFPWVSINAKLPIFCANPDCRSRQWNGPKKRVRTKITLPKPTNVRNGEYDDEF